MNRPCRHLAPVVALLTERGAAFTVVEPANGEVRFVHYLSKGPNGYLAAELARAHDVEYWVNKDAHYEMDAGFSCRHCRLAIAWKQDRAVVGSK